MRLTLSAAARATGLSKSTLGRAIKAGRLSAERDEAGTYQIDRSELGRVYGWSPDGPAAVGRPADPPGATPDAGPDAGLEPLLIEVAVLRERVASLTALLDREREATADFRRAMAALPSPTVITPPPPRRRRGLLGRLLGQD